MWAAELPGPLLTRHTLGPPSSMSACPAHLAVDGLDGVVVDAAALGGSTAAKQRAGGLRCVVRWQQLGRVGAGLRAANTLCLFPVSATAAGIGYPPRPDHSPPHHHLAAARRGHAGGSGGGAQAGAGAEGGPVAGSHTGGGTDGGGGGGAGGSSHSVVQEPGPEEGCAWRGLGCRGAAIWVWQMHGRECRAGEGRAQAAGGAQQPIMLRSAWGCSSAAGQVYDRSPTAIAAFCSATSRRGRPCKPNALGAAAVPLAGSLSDLGAMLRTWPHPARPPRWTPPGDPAARPQHSRFAA